MAVYEITKPLQRLLKITPGPHWIVSCYLKVEPRDRAGRKYLIKLKNRIRDVVQGLPALGLDREGVQAVTEDLKRVQAALEEPDSLPRANGVAAFACGTLKLFEVMPLPRVHRSRLLVDHTPLVGELAALDDEVGLMYTALLDRTRARIFEVTAFEAKEVADLVGEASRGGRFKAGRKVPGAGEHTYHNRIRNEFQRHLEHVAQTLFDLDRAKPSRGLVLGGVGSEGSALRPFLHPYISGKVLGTTKLPPKTAKETDVLLTTLEVRELYERRLERHAVAEMLLTQGEGWSVNGVGPSLEALGLGKVRILLVKGDASLPGFRCGTSGRLAITGGECRGFGEAVPVPDLIDDAIEEALRQRIGLEVVFEPDAAEAINGLAAMLRFK